MCIVIDSDTISRVFNTENHEHNEYKPIYDWINFGDGIMLYGGSRYRNELESFKNKKYRKLFNNYKSIHKMIDLGNSLIDKEEIKVRSKCTLDRFNDHHIISIICVSKCMLLCTHDKDLISESKNKKYYSRKNKIPKIYSSSKNKKLLSAQNLSPCKKILKKLYNVN